MMKNGKKCAGFRRVISAVLALVMLVCLMPSAVIAVDEGTTLYLKPNQNWLIDNARFAVYSWDINNGNYWADMTDADGDGYYEVIVPAGVSNIIFCRMNPGTTENNWNNKWNQTADLTVPTDGTNCYTVAESAWDKGSGEWSTYTTDVTLYLKPNANWLLDGARFAVYYWNDSDSAWADMTDADGDGYYEVAIPEDISNIIFCRMNPASTTNSWDDKWNQTADLTVPTDGTNCYTVADGAWDKGDGEWSVYPPEEDEGDSGNSDETIAVDYYLVGWINSADCNGTDYAFENGELTVTFTADSYVAVMNASGTWYMTDGWLGTSVTEATLGTSYTQMDKLYVPGNVEVTFTLTENSDGTLTLSYTTASSGDDTGDKDYYLVGYINGADYGIEADSANLGEYKFVDGKLTITFTQDSYVVVKDSNNTMYMAASYCTDASVTLAKGNSEKLYVPGNTELTFTLVENADGTLTLSYVVASSEVEIPEGYTAVTIHFLKTEGWGSAIYAYTWNGYDNGTWPGSTIPANASHPGWYDLVVPQETPASFNFIFNDGSNQTADLATGEVTGDTELWVIGNEVMTEAPGEWTGDYDYTANIYFQKPADWGDTINAWIWDANGKIPGYEDYNTTWPGKAIEPDPVNAGWYVVSVTMDENDGFNFIFNDGSNQTADLSTGTLNVTTNIWVVDGKIQYTAPEGFVDPNRKVYVPGTFPGPSWDAGSNQMTYDPDLGLYVITFENVAKGTYEYKIAINGSWNENYGAGGEANGDNIKVVVPTAQDVTIWYNDASHRTACSVYYDPSADITLSGTGIDEGTKLTDPELTGTFSVTVYLPAGTYSDLKVSYNGMDYSFTEFTMVNGKDVTFWFDPSTGLAYHNGSDVKVETDNIYYTTKDLDYKDPFGAVAASEEVTFSIDTGIDATAVNLIVKGYPATGMTKVGEPVDGVQRWTCTTTFDSIGEYEYYFAITNGSDMVFYCDDIWNNYYKTGDYGEGGIGNAEDIFAYDLVVYEAGFETPDWMKNAVIYQIFPDRFFDGDESNNDNQTWARGEADYEYVTDWYALPENPEQEALLSESVYKATGAYYGDGNWSNEIYGGDLEGIIDRIDYLKALGVNVIYLNPVFWSISNHRYDAVSYTEIDPILGTLGDFEELVAVAEANNMHIILDGVFNHVSDDSVYFDRYYKYLTAENFDGKIGAYPYWAYVYDYMSENGADKTTAVDAAKVYFSEEYGVTDYSYTEWFAVSSTPMTGSVDNIGLRAGKEVYSYEGWWGYDSMPVIYSTNGSEYQTGSWAEDIIDGENSVNAYWIGKGMDGWRLDVANEVSDETWQNFRDSVKALDSDAVIIGEIWADATRYLMGDMYDSVMNYVFRDAVAGFARGYLINRDNKAEKYDSDLTADEAMTILEILRERYPEEAFYAMMNLVASHDTSRILSYLDDVEDDRYQKDLDSAFPSYEGTSDEAKQLQYVVSFLQFTYAGAPTIYYGDEIGMVGSDDPDDRRAFTWGKGNQDIVEWYAELAAIRAAYPALRTGTVEPFSSGNDNVMSFVRSDSISAARSVSGNTLVVMANRAATAQTIAYEGTWVDLISGEKFTDTITVPAYRGVILVAEDQVKTITVNTAGLAPAYDSSYIVAERSATPPADEEEKPEETEPTDPSTEPSTEATEPSTEDTEATTEATIEGTTDSTENSGNNPDSGDSSHVVLWGMMMVMSAAAMAAAVYLLRRRQMAD